jgi:hypothetical protein
MKQGVSEADRNYYSKVIQIGYRPQVVIQSRIESLNWVYKGNPPAESINQALSDSELPVQYKRSSDMIRSIPHNGVSTDILSIGEEVAARRALQSLAQAEVAKPDAAAEIIRYIIDAATIEKQGLTERQVDEMRMQMMLQRIGGFAAQTARSELLQADNQKTVQQLETEIAAAIERHRITIGGKKSVQLGNVTDHATLVLHEQSARAEAVSKSLSVELVEKTLVGLSSAQWRNFRQGEIKHMKVISQRIVGHCILTEADLDMQATPNSPVRTVRIRMAHAVFLDGSLRTFAIN